MTLLTRIAHGIGTALLSAIGCSAIAVYVYASEGTSIVRNGGLTLGSLIAVYAATAVASGTILGLLRPFARGKFRLAATSAAVAWPVAFAIMLLARHARIQDLDAVDYTMSVLLAVIFGPLTVAYAHFRGSGQKPTRTTNE